MDLLELGEKIKEARKELNWSQTDLAKMAGVSRSRIDALENARASDMGMKNISRLLNALGYDLRISILNKKRPTLEDLMEEEAENASRLGR